MIPALVWKEFREQGLIVAALTVLGASILAAVGLLNPSRGDAFGVQLLSDTGFLAFVMLMLTAGVVVGGTLFAGEKEAGTYSFLILLPVARWKVWVGKMCGGSILVLAAAAVLFAVAAGSGVIGPPRTLAAWALGAFALVLAALAWGAVGSMWAKNSLTAAGVGALLGVLATGVIFPITVTVLNTYARGVRGVFSGQSDGSFLLFVVPLTVLFALFSIPFLISAWLYTAPDRDRKRRAIFGPTSGTKRKRRVQLPRFKRLAPELRASLWMCWRQMRLAAAILVSLAVLSGLSLLFPGVPAIAVWPPVTFFLALLVGVIGWADEQSNESSRFWVERRTPVGKLWLAKLIAGLAVMAAIVVGMALPIVIKLAVSRTNWQDLPTRILYEPWTRLMEQDFPLFRFALLWPVYGFAVGHLVGLLFRKAIVATAVSIMVGAVLSAVWLPSLLSGGIHDWQLWLPPLLLVLTARVLTWSMAADRIGGWRAMKRLAVGGALVTVAVIGGLAYRVFEIPDVPERNDDYTFRQDEIPPFDTNETGREIRRSAVLLSEALTGKQPSNRAEDLAYLPTPVVWFTRDPFQSFPEVHRRPMQITLEHGWQPGDAELDAWLDRTLANGWVEVLEDAASLPVRCVEDATELTTNKPLIHLAGLTGADVLLLVQGLRQQAEGDPSGYVRAVRTVLALSRNLRNKSIQACGLTARGMERRVYQTLPHWLNKLNDRRDLVREVFRELVEHDRWAVDDIADVRLAEQVVLRNTLKSSGEVLRRQWQYGYERAEESTRSIMDMEADLVGVSWEMPWEKERLARLVGLGNRTAYPIEYRGSAFRGLPVVGWMTTQHSYNLAPFHERYDRLTAADRRGSMIALAVRLHEIEHGTTPPDLAALRPEYFQTVPLDPYDGQPMRYRISPGEKMTVTEQTMKPDSDQNEYAVDSPRVWFDHLGAVAGGSVAIQDAPTGPEGMPGDVEPTDFNLNPIPLAAVTGVSSSFVGPGGLVFGARLLNTPPTTPTGPFTRTVTLSAGTVVIWSVGPDKRDNGGTIRFTSNSTPGDHITIAPSVLNGDR